MMMMHPELNIRRTSDASPSAATELNLSQLLDEASSKARRARDIADGIEHIEEVTWDDLIEISNMCSAALRLIKDAKAKAPADPQPPAPAPALALVPAQTKLAA